MVMFNKLALTAGIGAILAANGGVQAAEVSYNSTTNIEQSGRTATASGQGPFVAGLAYANAGNPNYGNPNATSGGLPVTWYTVLGANDTATLSSADVDPNTVNFGNQGGVGGGILSVGASSYQNVATGSSTLTSITPTNWGHNADFGLLQLSSAANVTITVSADASLSSHLSPGFSVWQGWDTNSGLNADGTCCSSTRHGTWLNNGAPLLTAGSANPGSNDNATGMVASGLNVFEGTAWTSISGGSATLTLNGLAAGDYSILIGGYQGYKTGFTPPTQTGVNVTSDVVGGKGGLNAPYTISFTSTAVSAVPVPGAVWLFGSALAGLLGVGRRKQLES